MQSAKRRHRDVNRIIAAGYQVDIKDEKMSEFEVIFKGPPDSPYKGGEWTVRVMLPEQYPIKSPSIGFMNKIYHPNIDDASGSVCLDVINQQWSPMFELVNIFDTFLPQLLLYPNPTDPLNAEAAALQIKSQTAYEDKIKDFVRKYAQGNKNGEGKEEQAKKAEEDVNVIEKVLVPEGIEIDQLSQTSGCELIDVSGEWDEEMLQQ